MTNPYTKNIIFFDTEFSSLDLCKGEILSLAFVKLNGDELYLELEFEGEADEWPKNNILPNLTNKKMSKEQAIALIEKFIGDKKPYVIAYVNQFDIAYFYKLFGLDNFNDKFNWIPVDFASILFSLGINPEVLFDRKKSFFENMQIDLSKYTQHNALDDARLLREVYLKLSID